MRVEARGDACRVVGVPEPVQLPGGGGRGGGHRDLDDDDDGAVELRAVGAAAGVHRHRRPHHPRPDRDRPDRIGLPDHVLAGRGARARAVGPAGGDRRGSPRRGLPGTRGHRDRPVRADPRRLGHLRGHPGSRVRGIGEGHRDDDARCRPALPVAALDRVHPRRHQRRDLGDLVGGDGLPVVAGRDRAAAGDDHARRPFHAMAWFRWSRAACTRSSRVGGGSSSPVAK